jgi:multidrug efflux pump subunit AcrA (membrane-fusion protein)
MCFSGSLLSCGSHDASKATAPPGKLIVKDSGRIVQFPPDSITLHSFTTEKIGSGNVKAELNAPARVVATILRSTENAGQNLMLFDNPELTANYTALLQHLINIREKSGIIQQKKAIASQKEVEVARFSDLASHGAGTGKDVSDAKTDLISAQTDMAIAQTELANEKTAIIEDEARLQLAGFNPEALIHAKAGKVWVICDIPESLVNKVKAGSSCLLHFTSYPQQTFTGTVESIGEVVDNITRMVKLRIGLSNSNNQLRAGMFASVQFGVSEGEHLSVPKAAMITVQGRNYVFVKRPDASFERKEVMAGSQVNDRIIIYSGLLPGDEVVSGGAMQLKGLSFGY